MKIRAVVTAIALFSAAACGSATGTPTAGTPSSGAESPAAGAASEGDTPAGGMDTSSAGASDDGGATDSDTGADDGAVDQGAVDQPSADDDTDSAGAGGSGDAEFCQQLIAAEKQLDSIDQAFGAGDMASADKALTADMDVFQKLAASAPSEVAPAMQDIIAALTAAQKAVSGGAAPDPSALAGMGNMTNDLNALGNYVADSCYMYAG